VGVNEIAEEVDWNSLRFARGGLDAECLLQVESVALADTDQKGVLEHLVEELGLLGVGVVEDSRLGATNVEEDLSGVIAELLALGAAQALGQLLVKCLKLWLPGERCAIVSLPSSPPPASPLFLPS
jgi:hypothetical protein